MRNFNGKKDLPRFKAECCLKQKSRLTGFLVTGFGDFRGIALANFRLSCCAVLGRTSVVGKSSKFVDSGLSDSVYK